MQHRINAKKLNRTSSHRKALLKNMANSLVMHEQIITTLAKAKTLKPYVEKLITLGKRADLNAKRKIISKQQDKLVMKKLCDVLSIRYEQRKGGYTRLIRAGFRHGDMAPLAVLEFVERDVNAKGKAYGSPDLDLNEIFGENTTPDNKVKNTQKAKKSEVKDTKDSVVKNKTSMPTDKKKLLEKTFATNKIVAKKVDKKGSSSKSK